MHHNLSQVTFCLFTYVDKIEGPEGFHALVGKGARESLDTPSPSIVFLTGVSHEITQRRSDGTLDRS
jgi:hypothetical protein